MTKKDPRSADLKSMDDEELLEAWTALGEEAQAVKERLKEFSQEHQSRAAQRELEVRLGSLNDRERAALLQYVDAQGVESEAAVGEL